MSKTGKKIGIFLLILLASVAVAITLSGRLQSNDGEADLELIVAPEHFYYEEDTQRNNLTVCMRWEWPEEPGRKGTDVVTLTTGKNDYATVSRAMTVTYLYAKSGEVAAVEALPVFTFGSGTSIYSEIPMEKRYDGGKAYAAYGEISSYFQAGGEDIKMIVVSGNYIHDISWEEARSAILHAGGSGLPVQGLIEGWQETTLRLER